MAGGVLIARLILGLAIAAHGAQKLFGWFGGYGLRGAGEFFSGLGFRPGVLFALAVGLGEVGGGLLTAAGLFGTAGPALVILVMLVAIVSVHWPHGFFAAANGIEVPLLYLTAALAIAFAGPGLYSLDGLFGLPTLSSTRRGVDRDRPRGGDGRGQPRAAPTRPARLSEFRVMTD